MKKEIKITPNVQKVPWGIDSKGKKFFGLKIDINIDKLLKRLKIWKHQT